MPTHLIRKLARYGPLSDHERRILQRATDRIRTVEADGDIVADGETPGHCRLLAEGFAARTKMLQDGRRQLTAIHVKGDFLDLNGFLLSPLDHGVLALTRCAVAEIPHRLLTEITEEEPNLTRLLWRSTLIDAATQRAWMVSLGRRSSVGHCAHLLCELCVRLEAVGEVSPDRSFRFPITQTELGDALGISSVHANRVLQELRGDGLIVWSGGTVRIEDWDRLAALASFDPAYLGL
ncbi:Crp/Fnr family transcriptional regulator [Chthonobacter rhizosphaerae]|uniref:Crp/Fnr family transcriptional regulator n=1 Tax=Chthonobacter rhizosphaerae TaxID=2735553 RepID=UPI0015EEEBFB|nr:Crp/Fnr family transcriptional regulator [Chthonobacter rhizosphaerae]